MQYLEIGKTIKKLRIQSGFSQDELATMSQISLRTVQRIENGVTEPRGDSLKRIAKSLGVNVQELTISTEEPASESIIKEDKRILVLTHFSALGFWIFPILGVIFPLVLWIVYKDKIKYINEIGRKIIKHQAYWCVLIFMLYAYVFSLRTFHLNLPLPQNGKAIVISVAVLYVLNTFIVLINAFKASKIKKSN